MFQGRSALSLDAKGRMSVPTRHRDALTLQCEGRLTLTRHPDGCLLLYPRTVWESVRERIAALPIGASGWKRFFSCACTPICASMRKPLMKIDWVSMAAGVRA